MKYKGLKTTKGGQTTATATFSLQLTPYQIFQVRGESGLVFGGSLPPVIRKCCKGWPEAGPIICHCVTVLCTTSLQTGSINPTHADDRVLHTDLQIINERLCCNVHTFFHFAVQFPRKSVIWKWEIFSFTLKLLYYSCRSRKSTIFSMKICLCIIKVDWNVRQLPYLFFFHCWK